MIVKTEWWGCVLYAVDTGEEEQLRHLWVRTGTKAVDPYEDGDITLLVPGEPEWDRLHGRDSLLSPPDSAVAGLVIRR